MITEKELDTVLQKQIGVVNQRIEKLSEQAMQEIKTSKKVSVTTAYELTKCYAVLDLFNFDIYEEDFETLLEDNLSESQQKDVLDNLASLFIQEINLEDFYGPRDFNNPIENIIEAISQKFRYE